MLHDVSVSSYVDRRHILLLPVGIASDAKANAHASFAGIGDEGAEQRHAGSVPSNRYIHHSRRVHVPSATLLLPVMGTVLPAAQQRNYCSKLLLLLLPSSFLTAAAAAE